MDIEFNNNRIVFHADQAKNDRPELQKGVKTYSRIAAAIIHFFFPDKVVKLEGQSGKPIFLSAKSLYRFKQVAEFDSSSQIPSIDFKSFAKSLQSKKSYLTVNLSDISKMIGDSPQNAEIEEELRLDEINEIHAMSEALSDSKFSVDLDVAFIKEKKSGLVNYERELINFLEKGLLDYISLTEKEQNQLKGRYLIVKHNVLPDSKIQFNKLIFDLIEKNHPTQFQKIDEETPPDTLVVDSIEVPLKFASVEDGKLYKKFAFVLENVKNENPEFSIYLEKSMAKLIQSSVLKCFDSKCEEIEKGLKSNILSSEEIEGKVEELFQLLNYLGEIFPDSENESTWVWFRIDKKFSKILKIKTIYGEQVEVVIKKLFAKYQRFIEEGEAQYRFKHTFVEQVLEKTTSSIYGRSAKEQEELKSENRVNAAKYIADFFKQPNQSKKVSILDLETLHAINNRGIVPQSYSKIRPNSPGLEYRDNPIFFGKRVGVHVDDVEKEVSQLLSRVNTLLERDSKKPLSKLQWSIEVAKLQNELLDIHPFWDRNGSTALLFAEMLMTKKGHKPNPIREKGGRSERYYKRLINVFSNPIAISIVAYENYKIALQPGFYNSRFVPLTQERKKYYNEWMQSQNLG